MTNTIYYEWDYEETDDDGDIIDHNFSEKLSDFRGNEPGSLVLVMNVGNEADGLNDRAWAYVKDGSLPKWFTDVNGCEIRKVPQRFHKELKEYLSK